MMIHAGRRRTRTGFAAAIAAIAASCSDAGQLVDPVNDPDSGTLAAYLVEEGFRSDMIIDEGDRFVVEGDIVIPKAALRRIVEPSESGDGTPKFPLTITKQYRADVTVSSANSERIVLDLSQLDANAPEWASAARLAIQDWNDVSDSWLRFTEVGSPVDIHVVDSVMASNVGGRALFPFHAGSGEPGHRVWLNPDLDSGLNTAATRRFVVAHELGHAVGLRHTNWRNHGEGNDPAHDTLGAVFIPGTVEDDGASIMNGGTIHAWPGFSTHDVTAIGALYPPPSVGVLPPGGSYFVYTLPHTVTFTLTVGNGGSGQFTHEWVRQNSSAHPSGWFDPFVIGTGESVSVTIDVSDCVPFGPTFWLRPTVYGLEGQAAQGDKPVTIMADECSSWPN